MMRQLVRRSTDELSVHLGELTRDTYWSNAKISYAIVQQRTDSMG
jgi:hypothetical protein